jgi:hypothetical protein
MQATWLSYLSTRDGAQEIESTVEALATQNAHLSTVVAAQQACATPAPIQTATPTPWVASSQIGSTWVYPAGVHTGIPGVDAVIDAVLAKDTEALRELVRYSTFDCTTADGLGGPPKCKPGEAEGTPVQALPIAGVEGHYSRPEQIDSTLEFATEIKGLVAVYRVTVETYEASWPAGQYGIIFFRDHEEPPLLITLRVEDGRIVRLDYQFTQSANEEIEQVGGEVILPPVR